MISSNSFWARNKPLGTLGSSAIVAAVVVAACGGSSINITVVDGLWDPGGRISVDVNGSPDRVDLGQIFVNASPGVEQRARLEGIEPYVVRGDQVILDLTDASAECRPRVLTGVAQRPSGPVELDGPAPGGVTRYDSLDADGLIVLEGDCTGAVISVE